MKILQRYVLSQLVPVFLLALAAFTAIFVLYGIVQQATQQGLSPVQVLSLVPLVIPASLPYTVPATLLLAVTIVYGRMAADSEITATKAAGINVLTLVMPALALGIALSVVMLFVNDHVIPRANLRMRTALVNNIEEMVYAVLRKEHMLKTSGMPYEIHAPEVRGKRLMNMTIKRRTRGGTYDLVVFAQEAALEFDLPNRLVRVHMSNAEVTDGDGVRFIIGENGEKILPIGMPTLDDITPGIRELTNREIERRKIEVRETHQAECARWAFGALGSVSNGELADVSWGTLVGLSERGRDAQRKLWRLGLEPHMRGALAFGCFAFVLLGCAVAILFQRGDYLSAFISCFLPIVVLYYPLLMFGYNVSKEGIYHPIVLWSANGLLIVLAYVAFRPVLRH